jgi:hypothetical protein
VVCYKRDVTCKGKQAPVSATTHVHGGGKPPLARRGSGVHVRLGVSVLAGMRNIRQVGFVGVVGAVTALGA